MKILIKILFLTILLANINSCGRKGPMEYPGGQEMPDYEKVIDPGIN